MTARPTDPPSKGSIICCNCGVNCKSKFYMTSESDGFWCPECWSARPTDPPRQGDEAALIRQARIYIDERFASYEAGNCGIAQVLGELWRVTDRLAGKIFELSDRPEWSERIDALLAANTREVERRQKAEVGAGATLLALMEETKRAETAEAQLQRSQEICNQTETELRSYAEQLAQAEAEVERLRADLAEFGWLRSYDMAMSYALGCENALASPQPTAEAQPEPRKEVMPLSEEQHNVQPLRVGTPHVDTPYEAAFEVTKNFNHLGELHGNSVELNKAIAAAIAKARREGAEAMREAAKAAIVTLRNKYDKSTHRWSELDVGSVQALDTVEDAIVALHLPGDKSKEPK